MTREIFLFEQPTVLQCNAEVVVNREYQPIICADFPGHRSSWRRRGPITIDLDKSDGTDCLWTWMWDCLLNTAVIEELKSHRVQGFETDDVLTVGNNRLGFDYAQFKHVGWGGMAGKGSGIEPIYHCKSCGHTRFSPLTNAHKLFDPQQWDGSDVFMIWPLSKFIFITDRVAKLLRDLEISGLEIIQLDEIGIEGKELSAGRIGYYLPPEKATSLQSQLGFG